MAIEKIVVGADFSVGSQTAADQALHVARHTGASITLVHVGVVPDLATGVEGYMRPTAHTYNELLAERLEMARTRLTELVQRMSGQGAVVSQMFIEGFADTAITRAATELGADLVVVGSRGRTGMKRFLLGSVAERVVRWYDRNVLVARGDVGNAGFAHILVPTDFSEGTNQVLDAALELAAPGAHITLLHCWHLPPLGGGIHHAPGKLHDAARNEIAEAVRARAASFFETRHSDNAQISFVETETPHTIGIQSWLDDNACDLVVMGSHGRRGLRRLILGSTAEVTVRHAPCSVLVVHPTANDDER